MLKCAHILLKVWEEKMPFIELFIKVSNQTTSINVQSDSPIREHAKDINFAVKSLLPDSKSENPLENLALVYGDWIIKLDSPDLFTDLGFEDGATLHAVRLTSEK